MMTKKYTHSEKFRGYRGYYKCGINSILPALFVVLVLSAFAHQCYGFSIASTPRISSSPASLNFGNVKPGATSLLKTITVKNTGTSDLVIGNIDITGTNTSEFSQTNNCTKITAGASCVISGTFTPALPFGNKSAIASITPNDPAKPTANVKLSGSVALVPRDVGAVLQTSGLFGALMVGGKAGEMLLPIVDRDASGNATKITGALYMNNDTGNSAVVYLGEDGRPTKTVMGDFILLFSNWSANGTTVNIALHCKNLHTHHIEVLKGVNVDANIATNNANREVLSHIAPMTCLPACGNDTKTLAELLKFSGLLIADGLCVVAIPASLATIGKHRCHPLKGPLSRKYFPLNKKYYVFCRGRSNTRRSAPILPLCPHPHFLCSLVRKSFLIYTGHPSGFQILPVLRTCVSSRGTQKIIGSMPCPNVCISTYGYKPTLDKLMA
jgi:hypothetical protein